MTAPHFPFFRPSEGALPPEQVRITELRGEPDAEGKKVRVYLGLTPFLKPPHISVTLSQSEDQELAYSAIIEPATERFTFNMHAVTPLSDGPFFLDGILTYPDTDIQQSLRWVGEFSRMIDP